MKISSFAATLLAMGCVAEQDINLRDLSDVVEGSLESEAPADDLVRARKRFHDAREEARAYETPADYHDGARGEREGHRMKSRNVPSEHGEGRRLK